MSSDKKDDRFADRPPRRPRRGEKEGPEGKESFTWKGPIKSLGFWVVIILAFIFIYSLYSSSSKDVAEISYTEFLQQLTAEGRGGAEYQLLHV